MVESRASVTCHRLPVLPRLHAEAVHWPHWACPESLPAHYPQQRDAHRGHRYRVPCGPMYQPAQWQAWVRQAVIHILLLVDSED